MHLIILFDYYIDFIIFHNKLLEKYIKYRSILN
jgi:hypothetical protein